MSIKDESRVNEILEAIYFLENYEIEVGIFEDRFKNGDELTVYGKAVINEYGATIEVTDKMRAFLHYNDIHLKEDTTEIIIPERSFIRGSFDTNKSKIDKSIENMLDDVINGTLTAKDFVRIIGDNSVEMIQKYIRDGISPENAKLTLENKSGTTPLRDTNELYKNISWRVVKK